MIEQVTRYVYSIGQLHTSQPDIITIFQLNKLIFHYLLVCIRLAHSFQQQSANNLIQLITGATWSVVLSVQPVKVIGEML